jgi:hypothetical protein
VLLQINHGSMKTSQRAERLVNEQGLPVPEVGATLWAAVIDADQASTNILLLTRLGGGAFGNEPEWILNAMRRALTKVAGIGLGVRVVSYSRADAAIERLVGEFG